MVVFSSVLFLCVCVTQSCAVFTIYIMYLCLPFRAALWKKAKKSHEAAEQTNKYEIMEKSDNKNLIKICLNTMGKDESKKIKEK